VHVSKVFILINLVRTNFLEIVHAK
jgi:hypothetical protein